MDQNDFTMNKRYWVCPSANTVFDSALQMGQRLEPRVMALLCTLSAHAGRLVTRELLVKEIWKDYGGGEEGLTYAVSSLRRVLNDTTKTLIETVPKKGYILQAEIVAGKNIEEIAVERQGSVRQRILYPLVAMAVATAACAAVYFSGSRHQGSGHFTPTATVVPFEAVSGKSDETSSNTIVTTGNDGLLYKLKLVGDSPPEFYIDGRLLTPDEMQDHIELITNLKRQLQKRGND